jgi:hypothetical protein
MNTIEEIKNEMQKLYDFGKNILTKQDNLKVRNKDKNKNEVKFSTLQLDYNNWYTASLRLIKLLIPERYNDFIGFYKLEKRKPNYFNTLEYTISDYLNNSRLTYNFDNFDEFETFRVKFQNQLAIFNSCIENIDTTLFDIENLLQYKLYKSELEAAKGLLSNGFIRPAGALAGVILENHLKGLCKIHNIIINKKHITINDCNDNLKSGKVFGLVLFKKIQHLASIRNLCDHAGEREPNKDEVLELIIEVEKIIAGII